MALFAELAATPRWFDVGPPAELAEVNWFVPGSRFDADCGEDETCECFTPFTPVWTKGGGGRFIFGGCEVGLEIAVAMTSISGRTTQLRPAT